MNRRRGPRGNQLAIQAASVDEAGIVKLASKEDVNKPSNNVVTTAALTEWEGYSLASIENNGVLRIASQEDVVEGTKDDCAVTPKTLANWKGYPQVATFEEVLLGENDAKAITPKTLNAFLGGNPNLLLATDFEFNPMQQGTVINASKNGLIADRVIHDYSGVLETKSEITDITPIELVGKTFTKALKVTFQGGNNVTYWKIKLPIAGMRSGKHTLSMAVKGSTDAKINLSANQWFNAADGGDNAILNIGFSNNLDVSTKMQVLTAIVDLPLIEDKKIGKDSHIMIELAISMPPTDMALVIPFIKFEEGEQATNMPETNRMETLMECQRFQQIIRGATGFFRSEFAADLFYNTNVPFVGKPELKIFDEFGTGIQLFSAGFNDMTRVQTEPKLESFYNDGLHFVVDTVGVAGAFQKPCMLKAIEFGTQFIQARYEFPEN